MSEAPDRDPDVLVKAWLSGDCGASAQLASKMRHVRSDQIAAVFAACIETLLGAAGQIGERMEDPEFVAHVLALSIDKFNQGGADIRHLVHFRPSPPRSEHP